MEWDADQLLTWQRRMRRVWYSSMSERGGRVDKEHVRGCLVGMIIVIRVHQVKCLQVIITCSLDF